MSDTTQAADPEGEQAGQYAAKVERWEGGGPA
jgi:hypothetical protein